MGFKMTLKINFWRLLAFSTLAVALSYFTNNTIRSFKQKDFVHTAFVDLDKVERAIVSNDYRFARELCQRNLERIRPYNSKRLSETNRPVSFHSFDYEMIRLEGFYSNKLSRIPSNLEFRAVP